jgi:hypothetical protein
MINFLLKQVVTYNSQFHQRKYVTIKSPFKRKVFITNFPNTLFTKPTIPQMVGLIKGMVREVIIGKALFQGITVLR